MKSQCILSATARAVKWRRCKWQSLAIDFCCARERHDFAPLSRVGCNTKLFSHTVDQQAFNTAINYAVIGARGIRKNPSGKLDDPKQDGAILGRESLQESAHIS
jgi:hypothetical protein